MLIYLQLHLIYWNLLLLMPWKHQTDQLNSFLIGKSPHIKLQEELRPACPAPRIKVSPSRTSKATFLFIPSANIAAACNVVPESEFLILKCPVCSRTTFTSLQGLLNHARISHVLEWGTHEECVQACATVDPDSTSKMALKLGLAQYCPVFEHSLRWLWGPLVVKVLVEVYHSLGLTIPLVVISLRLSDYTKIPPL